MPDRRPCRWARCQRCAGRCLEQHCSAAAVLLVWYYRSGCFPALQVSLQDFSRYLRSIGNRLETFERNREALRQRMQQALSPGHSMLAGSVGCVPLFDRFATTARAVGPCPAPTLYCACCRGATCQPGSGPGGSHARSAGSLFPRGL